MNFHFKSKDSIFYILSTLKKLPSYRHIFVYIESDHSVFDHLWWGKQLQEIIQKNSLQIVFLAKNLKQREYYEKSQLTFEIKQRRFFLSRIIDLLDHSKFRNSSYNFSNLNTKLYIILLITELLLFVVLIWMLWKFIAPNTEIIITPNYTVDTIALNLHFSSGNIVGDKKTLSLHSDFVEFEYNMSLLSNNIKYYTQPAQGEVTIYNYLPYEIQLIKNTKLITEDKTLYKTTKEVKLFASNGKTPTTKKVRVIALDFKEDGSLIGKEGNKENGTKLFIKNMAESSNDMKIYAQITKKLEGGATISSGLVLEKDVSDIQRKSIEYVMQEKTNLLQERLRILGYKEIQPILFSNFINITNISFVTNVVTGDITPFIDSKMKGKIEYYYVYKKDIEKYIKNYLLDRTSFDSLITDVNLESIIFESIKNLSGSQYIIPTNFSITQQYDFGKDYYEIINEIREKIKGMNQSDAKIVLLDYDFIAKVAIQIFPWWYRSISGNPKRIHFYIDNNR